MFSSKLNKTISEKQRLGAAFLRFTLLFFMTFFSLRKLLHKIVFFLLQIVGKRVSWGYPERCITYFLGLTLRVLESKKCLKKLQQHLPTLFLV
ncbi:conserved hypothetical protein [Xenorhabdus bovienii str. kraussei Quebec]|uniref:Uncharacterized protein n=1 Tax=Xenorhabdus bovienii str. kraussei Quebec TaxID=1398203 RepID=A0A077PIP8_XENBV|nr:conserved hypothetical protein [Xenorhabdus bovienii str. kraussei Quebec]